MKIETISTQESIHIVASDDIFPVGVAEASIITDNKPKEFYFNRLFVQKQYREKGISKILLKKLLDEFDKKDLKLILQINPYGPVTFEKLEQMYLKEGFQKEGDNYYIRIPKLKREHNENTL